MRRKDTLLRMKNPIPAGSPFGADTLPNGWKTEGWRSAIWAVRSIEHVRSNYNIFLPRTFGSGTYLRADWHCSERWTLCRTHAMYGHRWQGFGYDLPSAPEKQWSYPQSKNRVVYPLYTWYNLCILRGFQQYLNLLWYRAGLSHGTPGIASHLKSAVMQ